MEQLDTALQLYRRSQLHPARERRARILEKRGELVRGRCFVYQILATPWRMKQSARPRVVFFHG